MKTTRKSIFETSSSSTHSIIIDHYGEDYCSITPDRDGNIVLEGGEFGWEVENFHDPITKANYCAVDQYDNEENMEMLKKVLKDQTGASDVIIDFDLNDADWTGVRFPYIYIDHQSAGTSNEAFESEQTLKDFIFGKNSILHTDNDNY